MKGKESKERKEVIFNDIRKMFDELLAKGYKVEEVLNFPVFVGGVGVWKILYKWRKQAETLRFCCL